MSHLAAWSAHLTRWLSSMRRYVSARSSVSNAGLDIQDIRDAALGARREWDLAERYFHMVTDPDLIDHAIYSMCAAEQKYTYFLKKARSMATSEQGLPGRA